MKTQEIERKFLVKNMDWKTLSFKKQKFQELILSKTNESVIRLRVIDGLVAILTIKENSINLTREERELSINIREAKSMLDSSSSKVTEKLRYFISHGGKTFTVDEFLNSNKDFLAEIELDSEFQEVNLPDWIGLEVTGNPTYYSSYVDNTVGFEMMMTKDMIRSFIESKFKDWMRNSNYKTSLKLDVGTLLDVSFVLKKCGFSFLLSDELNQLTYFGNKKYVHNVSVESRSDSNGVTIQKILPIYVPAD